MRQYINMEIFVKNWKNSPSQNDRRQSVSIYVCSVLCEMFGTCKLRLSYRLWWSLTTLRQIAVWYISCSTCSTCMLTWSLISQFYTGPLPRLCVKLLYARCEIWNDRSKFYKSPDTVCFSPTILLRTFCPINFLTDATWSVTKSTPSRSSSFGCCSTLRKEVRAWLCISAHC